MNQNNHFNANHSAGGFEQQLPMAGGFGKPSAEPFAQGFGDLRNQPMDFGTPDRAFLKNSPMAVVSLVSGILGLTCCGGIGAIVAIVTGVMAKKEIQARPDELKGSGMATAGIILGIIGIVGGIIAAIIYIATLGMVSFLEFMD